MTITFTDARIENYGGADMKGVWLCLKVNEPAPARQFVLQRKDKTYTAELKEYREKRSLRANRYLWELLGRLAEAIKTTDEELYLEYVKRYGIYKQFELTEDEYKTFKVVWSAQGKAWPVERVDYTPDGERFEVHAYYGSSVYNTKQMGRLLDSVIEDCKEQGIETDTPDKLALLKEEWGNA